jgi:hypothetical protein
MVTVDGTERHVDAVGCATGFHVTDWYTYIELEGADVVAECALRSALRPISGGFAIWLHTRRPTRSAHDVVLQSKAGPQL